MLGRIVRNGVRCVESKAVQVELFHPVEWVLREMSADGRGVRTIQVKSSAPWGMVRGIKVVIGIGTHVVSVGSKMVVDHIENDCQARLVGGVYQGPQVVRFAVRSRRRIDRHAVVSPVPVSGK